MKPLVAISVCTGAEREIPDRNLPKIHENLSPTVKSEIQIRENFFPRTHKTVNPRNLTPAKISCHTVPSFYSTCKRTQQLPTLLGVVVTADVGCCWKWCANGCDNFAISRPSWTRKLTIFARISATGIPSVSLVSFPFSLASVLVFLLPFLRGVIILAQYQQEVLLAPPL